MQCSARAKGSGTQCRRRAIEGGNVCIMHGGSAPQVKKAARERIAEMVDPALGVLQRAMKMKIKGGDPAPAAILVARDIMDRAGYKATDKIQLTGTGVGGAISHSFAVEQLKAELDALHERQSGKS